MTINNSKQLTIDTATRTSDARIFASRKSAVKGQRSKVKGLSLGFTLIETMVAISILFIAVTGPIALMGKATLRTYYAKDEMVAINLAQEGVEAVRQKRDSNMLGAGAWDAGITAGTYIFDARTLTLASVGSTNIYQDTDGYYRQGAGGTATPFTRTIIITDIIIGVEKKIVSTATWQTGGTVGTVDATSHIFKQVP